MKRTTVLFCLLAAGLMTGRCFAQASGVMQDQSKMLGMPGADEDFLKEALDDANAEHSFAMDAKTHATDADVKAAAAEMELSSVDTIKRLAAYAPSLGVKMPKELTSKHKKDLAKLGDAGPKYDQLWVKDMVNLHHDTISLYRAEVTNSHEQQYQKLASSIQPTEEKDSATLKTLQAKVGK